jgi:class 3 adenylate cyclase/CheY-like chemotaxis protein
MDETSVQLNFLTRNEECMKAGQITILIAEDESIIALDIKRIVEKFGYRVSSVVNNFDGAVKALETEVPDLILMDIQINGTKNGIEAAGILYEKYSVPFIYLTALTDDETLDKAKRTEPFGYVVKPFDDNTIHSAIEMALYKHTVEAELKKKSLELEKEKRINDQLLRNILPESIINELKNRGVVSPKLYNNISILFTDFEAINNSRNDIPPEVLLNELNDIFAYVDNITKKYSLEKLKTVGEMYMLCGGIPDISEDHAKKTVLAAFDIQEYLDRRNKFSEYKWIMRAGINSGQAVAGTIGISKTTYDVWGETVNIASRLETTSEPGKINISGSTYFLIKDYFDCEYRGKLTAKGKGKIDMYYVNRIKKHYMN